MDKLYDRIDWKNNTTPALNAANLNAMSKAIDDIDDRVVFLGDDVLTIVPQIQAYLEQADDLVQALEELSQNPPYIGANGNWYVFNTTTEQYEDSGVDASITVTIADVTMLAEGATPYVTNTGTNTDPVFHLFIPIGATGNGISNIQKTSTSGNIDTYTITTTNGNTYTFTVTNGTGSGDMTVAVYDSTNAVANAGGIVAYISSILAAVATSGEADDVTYDNTTSGLTATDVQDAIDEVEGRLDTAEAKVAKQVYTTPVSALTGATSATIQNAAIHTTSLIFPYADNGTNTMMAPPTVTVTEGQAVLGFDALEQDTSFTLVVINP